MGRLVVGYWDCDSCDTKGISGTIRDCPNCGKPRDDNTKFYLNKDKIVHVSEEKAKTVNRNPDWICEYCNSLNSDNEKFCVSCGSARTKENLNYFENHEVKKRKEETKKSVNTTSPPQNESFQRKESVKLSSTTTSPKFPTRYVLITLAVCVLIVGLVYLFIPKTQEILIQELSWEYSINVEKFKTVEENGLTLPSDARLHYTKEEISHYRNVLDHYETRTRQVQKERISGYEEYVSGYKDLGNGYFEEITSQRPIYETYYVTETYKEPIYRSEPVYQTRYYYEIDKWVHERTVTTNGNTKETYWGDVNLQKDERISSKNEAYFVAGLNTKKEKQQKIQVSFEDWNLVAVDSKEKFKVSLGFGELIKEE